MKLTNLAEYHPPPWSLSIPNPPKYKLSIVDNPTKIEPWNLSSLSSITLPKQTSFWIKRDDATDFLASGNKLRKLEFLLADAIQKGCDSVVTIGGVQSNHCRATAAAACHLGLKPYLLLRHETHTLENPLEGNLMFDRLCGAELRLFTPEELNSHGGLDTLLSSFANHLRKEGKNPYIIPLGGSNALGIWGYLEVANELLTQLQQQSLTIHDVVVSLGSGGTAAGLGLGFLLAKSSIKVHAVCASDDAEYFTRQIDTILKELKVPYRARDIVHIIDGYKGIGYGKNTDEELQLLCEIATKTGIVLDPSYTFKAVRGMLLESNVLFAGHKVLFIHTGGLFGLLTQSKMAQLRPLVDKISPVQPLFPLE